jgi:monoamine oxidase
MSTHFAGEHIADWQGYMEGAINSGEDAAAEIIG